MRRVWINEGFVLDDAKTDTRSRGPYLCRALYTHGPERLRPLMGRSALRGLGSSSKVQWIPVQKEGFNEGIVVG